MTVSHYPWPGFSGLASVDILPSDIVAFFSSSSKTSLTQSLDSVYVEMKTKLTSKNVEDRGWVVIFSPWKFDVRARPLPGEMATTQLELKLIFEEKRGVIGNDV